MSNKIKFQGGLYPSVAVSDAFQAAGWCFVFFFYFYYYEDASCILVAISIYCLCSSCNVGHALAAKFAYDSGNVLAAAGFSTVCLAGSIGTLRFGFSESMFAHANESTAKFAAFVGLPMVGLSFMPLSVRAMLNVPLFIFSLGVIESLSRGVSKPITELMTVIVNVCCYVGPVAYTSYITQDYYTLGAISLFAFAGIVIKPERNLRYFGIRREDLFHYCIGVAAYFIGKSFK